MGRSTIFMKCKHCGSEWTIGKSVTTIDKCPFCGKPLTTIKTENIMTMASVLHQLINNHGIEVISDQKKCIAMFKDIGPKLKEEQKLLDIALRLGVGEFFISCSESERDDNIKKAKIAMAYLSDEAKELIIKSFVEALGWNKLETRKDFANSERDQKSKNVSGVATVMNSITEDNDKILIANNTINNLKTKKLKKNNSNTTIVKNDKNDKHLKNIMNEATDTVKKMAEKGSSNAQYELARRYDYGNFGGLAQDKEKAFEWYKKAAENNHRDSQYQLANCYFFGLGVIKNLEKAKYWYIKAAEAGDECAKIRLMNNELKRIVLKDISKSDIERYITEANQGNIDAQYRLAYCYEIGNGVNKDISVSIYWYKKAAEKGHSGAIKKLKELNIKPPKLVTK